MKIIKFTYKGDMRNDIHYEKDQVLLRYGSNEEEKPNLRDAIANLNTKAAEMARLTGVAIKRVSFSNPKSTTTEVKIECIAATMNGDEMKITLPKIGYRETMEDTGFGEQKMVKVPVKTDEDTMKVLIDLEESLKDYIVNGAGQLQFSFDEDVKNVS